MLVHSVNKVVEENIHLLWYMKQNLTTSCEYNTRLLLWKQGEVKNRYTYGYTRLNFDNDIHFLHVFLVN